ncbi:hypothetical protein CSPX01_02783, partial [Colletotrichum filicis]
YSQCYCGQGGIQAVVEPCTNCSHPRCSRCAITKVHIRHHNPRLLDHHHKQSPK